MAISNVPWFATTVEGRFGVGAVCIFATVVRAVHAFAYVWVIILVYIKFIVPEQTGSQYSHQYNIIIYKITEIVRALWLAESSICMRVCKHACGVDRAEQRLRMCRDGRGLGSKLVSFEKGYSKHPCILAIFRVDSEYLRFPFKLKVDYFILYIQFLFLPL